VLTEVLRFQAQCSDRYLVPGRNKSERHDAVYRRHSKWIGRWITDRTKTSYELRRYAGSRLLDMGATIFEVRDFLRHRDVQTTQMWYAYRLQNRHLRTIGMRELLPTINDGEATLK
jgi:integrase